MIIIIHKNKRVRFLESSLFSQNLFPEKMNTFFVETFLEAVTITTEKWLLTLSITALIAV